MIFPLEALVRNTRGSLMHRCIATRTIHCDVFTFYENYFPLAIFDEKRTVPIETNELR